MLGGWLLGLPCNTACVVPALLAVQVTSAVIPGLVASRMPAFFSRHREAVVMACKLLAAAGWPRFRLAWHAPGTPPDARAAFGGFSWLPVHPFGLVQTGALQMLTLSVRHALRFKAQLFCSLVMLFSVMQAEKVSTAGKASGVHASTQPFRPPVLFLQTGGRVYTPLACFRAGSSAAQHLAAAALHAVGHVDDTAAGGRPPGAAGAPLHPRQRAEAALPSDEAAAN